VKKFAILLGLVMALSLVFATGAFANFGPHGGYSTDTDSCAGCHRAHTSFSTLEFDHSNSPGSSNSLLVGNPASMTEFCNACHGDAAPGASTNVVMGLFDSGPSGENGEATGTVGVGGEAIQYETASTFGAALNGGGFTEAFDQDDAVFQPVTSSHNMEVVGPLWGTGSAPTNFTLNCADCHDPHGSTNYRLLKDNVNTNNVSLSVFGDDDPTWLEAEVNDTGWLRGAMGGAAQMAGYVPNYTGGTKLVNDAAGANTAPGTGTLSDWCAACHTAYTDNSSAYNYAGFGYDEGTHDAAGTSVGNQVRHRHPMNVSPASGDDILAVDAMDTAVTDAGRIAARDRIPLERISQTAVTYRENVLGCLTCHYAHGASEDMTGWAAATYEDAGTPGSPKWRPMRDGIAGVDPAKGTAVSEGTALLRADNRGVCERCHEK